MFLCGCRWQHPGLKAAPGAQVEEGASVAIPTQGISMPHPDTQTVDWVMLATPGFLQETSRWTVSLGDTEVRGGGGPTPSGRCRAGPCVLEPLE